MSDILFVEINKIEKEKKLFKKMSDIFLIYKLLREGNF